MNIAIQRVLTSKIRLTILFATLMASCYFILPHIPGQGTLIAEFLIFTAVPGWILCYNLPIWRSMPVWLRIPITLIVGTGLLETFSLIFKTLLLPMAAPGIAVMLFTLILLWLRPLPKLPPTGLAPEMQSHSRWLLAFTILLTVFVVLLRPVFYREPVTPYTLGEWIYTMYVRWSIVEPNEYYPNGREVIPSVGIDARLVFNGWNQALATLSATAAIDPVDVTWGGVQPLIVLLALWSVYALGRLIFDKPDYALIAVCFFAFYHLTLLESQVDLALNWQDDKYVAVFGMFNFVIATVLLYLKKPQKNAIVLLVILFWTITITHVLGLAVVFLGMGAVWLAFYGRRIFSKVALQQIGALVLCSLPALIYVFLQHAQLPDYIYAIGDAPAPALRHFVESGSGQMVIGNEFVNDIFSYATIALSLFVWLISRSLASRYIAWLVAFVALLLWSPLVNVAVAFMSLVQVVRLIWILPIGFAFACSVEAIEHLSGKFTWGKRAVPAYIVILLVFAMFVDRSVPSVIKMWVRNYPNRLNDADRWLVDTVKAMPEQHPFVFTLDNRSRYVIAGMTDARFTSIYQGFYGPKMQQQQAAYQSAGFSPQDTQLMCGMSIDESTRAALIIHDLPVFIPYRVGYLILTDDNPALAAVRGMTQYFEPYASHTPFNIFSVHVQCN